MNSNIYNFFLHITVTELCWDLHSQGSRLLELAVVIQLLRCYLTLWPWTMACQSSLSFMSPGVCSNLCPLNWWCYSTTSSSVTPFSCLQSFPASGPFPMSWLFASGGQNTGASASATILPINIQGWFSLGMIGLTSSQSKGLSRVFCSTTFWKHKFSGPQPSLWCYFSSLPQ